jgi:hypothetical protein
MNPNSLYSLLKKKIENRSMLVTPFFISLIAGIFYPTLIPLIFPELTQLHLRIILLYTPTAVFGIDFWGATAIIILLISSGTLCIKWGNALFLKRITINVIIAILLTLLLMPFLEQRGGVSVNFAFPFIYFISFFSYLDLNRPFRIEAAQFIFYVLFPMLVADIAMIPLLIVWGISGGIGGVGLFDALNVISLIVVIFILLASRRWKKPL